MTNGTVHAVILSIFKSATFGEKPQRTGLRRVVGVARSQVIVGGRALGRTVAVLKRRGMGVPSSSSFNFLNGLGGFSARVAPGSHLSSHSGQGRSCVGHDCYVGRNIGLVVVDNSVHTP